MAVAAALLLPIGASGYTAARSPAREPVVQQVVTVTTTRTVTVEGRYEHRSARSWARGYRLRSLQLHRANTTNKLLQRRWQPTVTYALRLASAVYGVPYGDLARVSYCESTWNPFATNGRYRGLFQEGPMFERGPFVRFGVFDPVANALTAAYTVAHDGSWRQWACG